MGYQMDFQQRDGRSVSVDPGEIVSFTKRPDMDSNDPPTEVHLDRLSFVTDDSIRTLTARLGDACPMSTLDLGEDAWNASVALRKITHLTKPEEDSANGDPTMVHMTNGQSFLADESIRTLSARLNLGAGIEVIDLDLPNTERPAAFVADHVVKCMRNRSAGISGETVLMLAGDWIVPTNDDVDALTRLIEQRRSEPDEDANEDAAPTGP